MSAEDEVQTLREATDAHAAAIKAAERAHRLNEDGTLRDVTDEAGFWQAVRVADAAYHETTKHLYLRAPAERNDDA